MAQDLSSKTSEIIEIKKEIRKLKLRNQIVETNKAWETSITSRTLLMLLTYMVASISLIAIGNLDPLRNAVIPTLGFLLSTLTLPVIKNFWIHYVYKK